MSASQHLSATPRLDGGGDERPVYLDHNATTPALPEVVEAMLPYLSERFGNPSSAHPYGREARAAVDRARAQVASLIGAAPEAIVFCSGGTEASNLAIVGSAMARPYRKHLVTTAVEHPATSAPIARLERGGVRVTRLPVDAHGVAELERAREDVGEHTVLVTAIHAHNETGAVQPIAELAQLAHAHGALVHADAAQSLGKLPVDVDALGVDLLTVAGHKLYAPKGVGALYVRQGTLVAPVLLGAGHERGLRPGTENVASIVGLGVACAIAERDLASERARVEGLALRLFAALASSIDGLALNGPPLDDPRRLPNTLSVRFPGVRGSDLLAAAPEVAASTGSACHDGEETAPSAIVAMGVSPSEALGTVRLTLGRLVDAAAIDRAADALVRAHRALGGWRLRPRIEPSAS